MLQLQMATTKNEMRATLLLTLCAVCLLPTSAATGAVDASSAHPDHHSDGCPSSRVAAECKACRGRAASDSQQLDISRCCSNVETYSACRDQLDTEATKSLVKRSIHQLDAIQPLDDDFLAVVDKRRTPFLGKRANPFLGKRKVNPFLGKRRGHTPFLGKRPSDNLDLGVFAEKRRMPFLG